MTAAAESLGTDPPAQPLDQLRSEWLEQVGPHAVMRRVRAANGVVVTALVVRPGSPANDVASITLRFHAPGVDAVEVAVPVFPLYRRQWSLDLSVGITTRALAAGRRWEMEAVLEGPEYGTERLVVAKAPAHLLSLTAFPAPESLRSPYVLDLALLGGPA